MAHGGDEFQRGRNGHALVGIHHHVDVRANSFADLLQPFDVAFQFRRTDLDLDRAESTFHVAGDFGKQFVRGVGEPATAAVERHAIMLDIEHPPDRLVERLGPGIPHGDVDGAERPAMDAGLAEILGLAVVFPDEPGGLGNFKSHRQRADVPQRAGNRLRRIMK